MLSCVQSTSINIFVCSPYLLQAQHESLWMFSVLLHCSFIALSYSSPCRSVSSHSWRSLVPIGIINPHPHCSSCTSEIRVCYEYFMPLTPQYSITCEVKSAPFFSNFSVRLLHAFIMQLDILVTVFRPSCNSRTVPDVFQKLSYSDVYWLSNIIEQVFSKGLMEGVCLSFL